MELEPDAVGRSCGLISCNELDFLPINCSCNKVFCTDHISPDKHNCTSLDGPGSFEGHTAFVKRQRCALEDCQKPTLQSAIGMNSTSICAACPNCLLSFCVDHRHPDLHSCIGLHDQQSDEKKHSQHVLARHFSNPSTFTPVAVRQTIKPPTDPKKLAHIQKVTLMKMRHSATPGDPRDKLSILPIGERLYIKARSEITGLPVQDRLLWFRKTVVTGKALDLISDNFKVPSSYQTLLCLVEKSDLGPSSRRLQNDLLLCEQVKDACTVILVTLPLGQNN